MTNNTYTWHEPDRKPLPPITNISFPHPKVDVPLLTVGLGAVAVLCLISVCFSRAWIGAPLLAVGFGLAAWATTGLNIAKVDDPFAEIKIEDEEAGQVFAQLHKNMFRAFDYNRESDVYDALANSVDGELLRRLYLDVNRSLQIKEQGGAAARVNEVNLLEGARTELIANADDSTGFGYRCKWNLTGTIEHWGHIHERTNEYDAQFEIKVRDRAWKITDMQVLNEEPPVIKTSLRKF